jgi:hypothetical protein
MIYLPQEIWAKILLQCTPSAFYNLSLTSYDITIAAKGVSEKFKRRYVHSVGPERKKLYRYITLGKKLPRKIILCGKYINRYETIKFAHDDYYAPLHEMSYPLPADRYLIYDTNIRILPPNSWHPALYIGNKRIITLVERDKNNPSIVKYTACRLYNRGIPSAINTFSTLNGKLHGVRYDYEYMNAIIQPPLHPQITLENFTQKIRYGHIRNAYYYYNGRAILSTDIATFLDFKIFKIPALIIIFVVIYISALCERVGMPFSGQ